MKPGTQADLRRHLESECGINVTRQAISLLVKDEDYRIHKTPKGKIKMEETAKALIDSGFGKRSEMIKRKNGKKSKKVVNDSKSLSSSDEQPDDDIQDYISGKKKITLATPTSIIHKYKELQKAESDRIKNDERLKVLVDFNKTADTVFNFLRPFRDDLLEVAKRMGDIAYMAASKKEAKEIIYQEIERIMLSRVGGDYKDDEGLKKKIIAVLKM